MAYTKTTWNNRTAPYINAANLNKIEQGIADAHDLADATSEATETVSVLADQNARNIADAVARINTAEGGLANVNRKADTNAGAIADTSDALYAFEDSTNKVLYYDNTNLIGDDASLLYYVGINAGESFVVNTSDGNPNYDRSVSLQFLDKDLVVLNSVDLIGRDNMLLQLNYDVPYMRFVGVPAVPWQVSKGIHVEPYEEYYIGLRKLKEQVDFIQGRFYDALDAIDMAFINAEYAAALAELAF